MFFQWSDLHSRNDPEPPQGGTQTEHELKQLLFAKWTDCFKSTEKFKRDNAKSSGLGDLKNKTKQQPQIITTSAVNEKLQLDQY